MEPTTYTYLCMHKVFPLSQLKKKKINIGFTISFIYFLKVPGIIGEDY